MDNNNEQNSFEGGNITPNEFVEGVTPVVEETTSYAENVTPSEMVEDVVPTDAVENAAPTGTFGGLKLHSDTPEKPAETSSVAPAENNTAYSDPFGADPMGLEPVVTSFGGNGGSNGPTKKGGKKTGLIVGIVALIAALAVCGILFIPKLFKSDKDVVKDAFAAAFHSNGTTVDNDSYEESVLGLSEIEKTIAEVGGQVDWTATVTGCELAPEVEGASVQLFASMDSKNKLGYAFLSCFSNVDSMKIFEGYVQDEKVYLEMPEMFDGIFYTSAAAVASNDNENIDKLSKEFSDAIQVKKTGTEKVAVNGNVIKSKEYTITIPKDAIVTYIKGIVDEAATQYKADPSLMGDASISSADIDTAFESVKMVVGMIFTKDIVAKAYVNDDVLVKFEIDDSLNLMGMATINYKVSLENDADKTTGTISFDVGGEKIEALVDIAGKQGNPSGSIVLNLGGESVSLKFDSNKTVEGSTESTKVNVGINYQGENFVTVEYNEDIDKSNNAGTGSAKVSVADAGNFDLSWKAEYSDIEKGKKFCKTLSDVNFAVDGESVVVLSFKQIYDTTIGEIKQVDTSAKMYDFNALSEGSDEYNQLIQDNADKVMTAMEKLTKIFGISTDELEDITEGDVPTGTDATTIDDIDLSSEDMTLAGDNYNVKILGSLDGFTVDYATPYGISFSDDDYNNITYLLYNDDFYDVDSLLEISEDDLYEGEVVAQEKTEAEVDGSKVYYAIVEDEYSTLTVTSLRIILPFEDGTFLQCIVTYDADTYQVDDLLKAVSKQYYEIVEE